MQRRAIDFLAAVNGEPYSIAGSSWRSQAPAINTTNSEGVTGDPNGSGGPGDTSCIPEAPTGIFSLRTATYDDSNSPYGAPISFRAGNYYNLEGNPSGEVNGETWRVPSALLTTLEHTSGQTGTQPVNADFQSDGTYFSPQE
jgi:hypothetical protein